MNHSHHARHTSSLRKHCVTGIALCLTAGYATPAAAIEDIEFVAEHLAEAAMDNRYSALPLWSTLEDNAAGWTLVARGGYGTTRTGNLQVAGPMFSVGLDRELSSRWTLGTFAFVDVLAFSGSNDYRPLQTLFAPTTPIARPVDSRFDNLDGSLRHIGIGVHVALSATNGWLGVHRWIGGVLWQRIELRDYRLDYEVLAGSSIGTRGQIDFDTDYAHVTPFIGLELPRAWTRWSIAPHALFALPSPKRGVVGHITGPGFDIHGNTEDTGAGKHFGDPSLTIGLDVTYLPAHFTVDVGTLITQHVLEPLIHKGVESNWVLSVQWRH
jgi:hypothetical protein